MAYQTPAPAGYKRVLIKPVDYKSRFSNLTPVTAKACEALGIKGLKETQLNAIGAQYDAEEQILHFKLRNAAQRVVGEKVLHLGDRREETFKGNCNSGLLVDDSGSGSKNKAVLVSNLIDFIVLATQNIESRMLYLIKNILIQSKIIITF